MNTKKVPSGFGPLGWLSPFAFFDLETTGLEPLRLVRKRLVPWHEIIEIGCVIARQRDLSVLHEFNIKVMPEHPERADKEALAVNGFTKEAWGDALPLRIALERFLGYAGGCVLIGQNSSFDYLFLRTALAHAGIPFSEFSRRFHHRTLEVGSVGVGRLLRASDPRYAAENFGSSALSATLGIAEEQKPHRALNGARHAYRMFKKLTEILTAEEQRTLFLEGLAVLYPH